MIVPTNVRAVIVAGLAHALVAAWKREHGMDKSRTWQWVEPGEDGVTPVVQTITDGEILDTYYRWWSEQMLNVGRSPMITEQNCIDDFVVIHWASSKETA